MLSEWGVRVPHILLPGPGIDLARWAVVACDQYTAEPEYWQSVDDFVGDSPSTLRMIWPEAWLGKPGANAIASVMKRYAAEGVFSEPQRCIVLVRRETGSGVRRGLLLALDLERYDFRPGSSCLIRATEGTVMDRLPPRIAIRRDASLELPHAMVLIDDPNDTVIGSVDKPDLPLLYDFELMMGGGRLAGYRVGEELETGIAQAIGRLADRGGNLLFAVGDGNHSLAAAREYWLGIRDAIPGDLRETHPARYALAEVVNLHDPALRFESIHRVLFHVDPARALAQLCWELGKAGEVRLDTPLPGAWRIPYSHSEGRGALYVRTADSLAVEAVSRALDAMLAGDPEMTIDYIHGEETALRLGAQPGRLGLLLPGFDKSGLFPAVRARGVLPRKSFSMGEAHEKRYYMECRRIH
ncbi:MAG: DUF1015 domain-containing protein [Clostridiales bacterium]|nr:DUF1015 domain-containing protein [Clostridiales bacterium]